jgi:hypothetical protein
MIEIIFIVLISIHALVHIAGYVKSIRPESLKDITMSVSAPLGIAWLTAGILYAAAALLFAADINLWWALSITALILSQFLIIVFWKDAKLGTLPNIVMLAAAVTGYGLWDMNRLAFSEEAHISASSAARVEVTDKNISALPPVVAQWLRRSEITGKSFGGSVTLKQSGEMRLAPDSPWIKVEASQRFNTAEPAFVWRADIVPFHPFFITGIDSWRGGRGRMLIKLMALFPVSDVTGREIDQGSMLRYLAEIVWFPFAALHESIAWKQTGPRSASAVITWGGQSAEGVFYFDENGDPSEFRAKRYFYMPDGSRLEEWVVNIDKDSFALQGGVRVPLRSTVTWNLDAGAFTWFRVDVSDIKW